MRFPKFYEYIVLAAAVTIDCAYYVKKHWKKITALTLAGAGVLMAGYFTIKRRRLN